jgi:hypothetical protein
MYIHSSIVACESINPTIAIVNQEFMAEYTQVKTLQAALELARAFASHHEVNESQAEAYAENWYEAGKDYDKATAEDLGAYLMRRFNFA